MASAFCEKSISWFGNPRDEDGYHVMTAAERASMYDCEYCTYDDEFGCPPPKAQIADYLTITQQTDGSFKADIWTNAPREKYVPFEEGVCYLPKATGPVAEHASFTFIDADTADADFEIFRPHIDKILSCLNMEARITEIYNDIRKIQVSTKLKKVKKEKKGKKKDPLFTEETAKHYMLKIQNTCKSLIFDHFDKAMARIIVKVLALAIYRIKIAPRIEEDICKENPHMSRKRR